MIDYFTTGNEAREMYNERLRQAEQRRRAAQFAVHASRPRSGLLVRAGEALVAIGERLKRQGDMTPAYGKR